MSNSPMQNLIKIEQRDGSNVVSARELHGFLQVKTRFNDWVSNRIKEYDFEEGRDFTKLLVKLNEKGRPETDYLLTLDMAKELAMVEKNERGKQARRYFIECEKTLRYMAEVPALPTLHKTIVQAVQVAGSQAKLAKRIGISGASLSQIQSGQLALFSDDMLRQVECVSRKVVDKGMGYDSEIMEELMRVDDKKTRLNLFKAMRKGGVL